MSQLFRFFDDVFCLPLEKFRSFGLHEVQSGQWVRILNHQEKLFIQWLCCVRLRWSLPSHLLDAIFSCCGLPILADVADSRVAIEILDELQLVINEGFATLQLQKSPHLALVSKNFYDAKMKKVLSKWLLLWLRARKVTVIYCKIL